MHLQQVTELVQRGIIISYLSWLETGEKLGVEDQTLFLEGKNPKTGRRGSVW